LGFTAAERVLYALKQKAPTGIGWVVIDLELVTGIDPVAATMLRRPGASGG
jgi:hypothetical protein